MRPEPTETSRATERSAAPAISWRTSLRAILLSAAEAIRGGAVGDLIRVTNTKSNQTVLAEIIDSRTVRVAAPQQTSSN